MVNKTKQLKILLGYFMSNVIRCLNTPDLAPLVEEPYLRGILCSEVDKCNAPIGRHTAPLETAEAQAILTKIRGFVVWRCEERGANVLQLEPEYEATLPPAPPGGRVLQVADYAHVNVPNSLYVLFVEKVKKANIVPRALPNPLPEIPVDYTATGTIGKTYLPEIIYMLGEPHLVSQVCKAWRNCQNSLYPRVFQSEFPKKNSNLMLDYADAFFDPLIPADARNRKLSPAEARHYVIEVSKAERQYCKKLGVNTAKVLKTPCAVRKNMNEILGLDGLREYKVQACIKELKAIADTWDWSVVFAFILWLALLFMATAFFSQWFVFGVVLGGLALGALYGAYAVCQSEIVQKKITALREYL